MITRAVPPFCSVCGCHRSSTGVRRSGRSVRIQTLVSRPLPEPLPVSFNPEL
jgi:hypothetical protein